MGALDQTTMRPVKQSGQIKMAACWQLTSESTQQGREKPRLEGRGCPRLGGGVGGIRKNPEPLLGLSFGLWPTQNL